MARWFRFYNETLDDPKAQKLAPALFKHWVNLLCLAARNDGHLPCPADCAFALRVSEPVAIATLKALQDAQLIDVTTEGMEPHNWHARQYASDVSTERVRRYRNGKRNVSSKFHETPSDTETDTEADKTPVAPKGARVKSDSLQADFDAWWAQYPRKIAKGAALKAYRAARAKPGITAETLLAGAMRFAAEREGQDPQYTAHPSTWLNAGRWDDQPESPHERNRQARPAVLSADERQRQRRAQLAGGVATLRDRERRDTGGESSPGAGGAARDRPPAAASDDGADGGGTRPDGRLGGDVQPAAEGLGQGPGFLHGGAEAPAGGPVIDGHAARAGEPQDGDAPAPAGGDRVAGGRRGSPAPVDEEQTLPGFALPGGRSGGDAVPRHDAGAEGGVRRDAGLAEPEVQLAQRYNEIVNRRTA